MAKGYHGDGYDGRARRSRSAYGLKPPPCRICGKDRDQFHDTAACAKEWNRQCDEQARTRTQGREARP